jgi:hypothetical protein
VQAAKEAKEAEEAGRKASEIQGRGEGLASVLLEMVAAKAELELACHPPVRTSAQSRWMKALPGPGVGLVECHALMVQQEG